MSIESKEQFLKRNPVYAKHMEQFEEQSEINRRERGNWTPAEKELMTAYRAAKQKEANAIFVEKQTGVPRGFSNMKGNTDLYFPKQGKQGGRRTRNKRSHRRNRNRSNKKRSHRNKRTRRNKRN